MENNNKKGVNATLSFDLTDVDGRMEYKRCNKSFDMACALFDINELCYKADDDKISVDAIRNIFNDYNIDIEELIY